MAERTIVFKDGVKTKVTLIKNWFIYVRSENIKVNKPKFFFSRRTVISVLVVRKKT